MGIDKINDYTNLIGNYRIPSIPSVSIEEVKRQDEQRVENSQIRPASVNDAETYRKPRNDAALEDISLTFNKGDDYGYIGKDSDIYSLDVENAISDMQKDNILKQYQFFVGNTGVNTIVNNTDGVVIPKIY